MLGSLVATAPAWAQASNDIVDEISEDVIDIHEASRDAAMDPQGEGTEKDEDDDKDKVDLTIAPIPSISPVVGAGLAIAGLAIYEGDAGSPAWTTGGGIYRSSNGSAAYGAFHHMALRDDAIRLTAIGGYANKNFTYFGNGSFLPEDFSAELNQKTTLVALEPLFRMAPHTYAGFKLRFREIVTSLREELDPGAGPTVPDGELDSTIVTIAPTLQFDNRDNQFFPTRGYFATARWALSDGAIGSDFRFTKFELSAAHYRPLRERSVLAFRASLCGISGDPAFYDECSYGAGGTLRGYEAGRYRDRFFGTLEAEFRGKLFGRFGYAVFAGVGTIGPEFLNFSEGRFLPSAGAGLRYRFSKDNPLNVRIDYAWGRDSEALYLSVGEAF